MGALIWFTLWATLTVLVIAAILLVYVRRRAAVRRSAPRVDDAAVRAIVETGALSVEDDEPLDMREIEAEEERFWRETWDEPEEV
jgi:hypothetical protein